MGRSGTSALPDCVVGRRCRAAGKRGNEFERWKYGRCCGSQNPTNGMVAAFMVQCPGPDQWAARDLFLKTATQVFKNFAP